MLQDLEHTISKHEKRPPAQVREENQQGTNGRYYWKTNTIALNSEKLNSESVYDSFKTFLEESRHAYQYYAIKHPGFHPNKGEERDWKKDFKSRVNDRDTYIEKDARFYSEEISKRLSGEHELARDTQKPSYSYRFEPHDKGATLILQDGRGGEVRKFLVSDLTQKEIQKVQLSQEQIEGLMRTEVGESCRLKGDSKEKSHNLDRDNPEVGSASPVNEPHQLQKANKAPAKDQDQVLKKDRDRDRNR